MTGFLVAINVVFLIAYVLYTTNNKIKYGKLISRKHKKIFNIVVFIIFITYVFLHTYLIYIVQPETVSLEQLRENKDSVQTEGNRLGDAVMWLIVSPIFWIGLFNLYKEITESFFRKKYISSNGNTDYYRGTLQNISPGIASFVLEGNVNVAKSVTADILKLQLEGYIIEEDNKLKCSNLDTSNLSKSDKLLIQAIKTNNFSDDKYLEAVEQEAIKVKLIAEYKNKFKKAIKIFLNTIPRIIIFILLICAMIALIKVDEKLVEGVLVFTNDDFSTPYGEDGKYYKARYIQIDEETYNKLKQKREDEISALVEKELEEERKNKPKTETEPATIEKSNSNIVKFNITADLDASLRKSKYRMQDLKDQLFFNNILGDHYVKASYVSVGIVSLDTLITIVQTSLTLLAFVSIVSFTNIVRFIIVSAKYSNKYVLTSKGMKLRKEVKGLKKYLKDYSLIKTRTKEEVAIWEYYLIYAIVLNENTKIENQVIKNFVNQIYVKK